MTEEFRLNETDDVLTLLASADPAALLFAVDQLRSRADVIQSFAKAAERYQELLRNEAEERGRRQADEATAESSEKKTDAGGFSRAEFRAVELVFETVQPDRLSAKAIALGAGLTEERATAVLEGSPRFACDCLDKWRMVQ